MGKSKPKTGVRGANTTDRPEDIRIDELLKSALAEPIPTEERLHQIEQVLEAARSLGLFGKDDAQDLRQLGSLARTYQRFAHLEKAYETFVAALVLAERLKDSNSIASLNCSIGQVLSQWSRWEQSLKHLEKSWKAYQELNDSYNLARVMVAKGILYQQQGRLGLAEEAYSEALEAARVCNNPEVTINANNNLAVVATVQGDINTAVARYQTCLILCHECADSHGMARAYLNLGKTHAHKLDWNAALECYERGFTIAQEQGMLEVMAGVYLARAEMMIEWEDASMASTFCSRALDIYQKTGNHLGEADVYRLLGRVFTLRKQWASAISMFQDSLNLNTKYNMPLNLAETYRDLGKMHLARNQILEARAAFEEALSGFKKLDAKNDIEEVIRLRDELASA